MKSRNSAGLVAACILFSALAAFGQVTPLPPYSVSVFATSIPGVDFAPDSIAVVGGRVFVGFGDGVAPDGSDGKSSTVVEYSLNGDMIQTFSVLGHNDGLKVNPQTKQVWAMQNEDANPSLVIIDPKSGTQQAYTFNQVPPHGGGYDDITFRGADVFFSASNPANNPNTAPAIVKAHFVGTTINVSPVLLGNANSIDVTNGQPTPLNLQDPDSMIFDPLGDLVLDSQADAELIIVHRAGFPDQSVFHLGLTEGGNAVQVDDTIFATSSHGVILVSDRDGETVYAITAPLFAPSAAYTATPNSVGRVDLDTGIVTPVVSGMVSPHGMAFIPE